MKKIVITSNCVSVPITEHIRHLDRSRQQEERIKSVEEAKRYFAEHGYVSSIEFAPSPFGTDVRHRFYRIEIVTDDDDECCVPDVGVYLESELPEMIEFEGETYVLREWGSYEHSANLEK